MKDSLHYQAAKLVFGSLDADTMKQTVDELMNNGLYADECLDALDSSPARYDEVFPAFNAALSHYGIVLPTRDEAVWQLIQLHLQQIASGACDPLEGLSKLIADVYFDYDFGPLTKKFLGDSHGIERLIGLHWSQDELNARPGEVSMNGKYGDEAIVELKREVFLESERWLAVNARSDLLTQNQLNSEPK
jgi:hypothetical protein